MNKLQVDITGIIIADPEGGYSAYFAEFPDVVAQGETVENAQINLFEALKIILEVKREDSKEFSDCPVCTSNANEHHYKFELAI